MCIPSHYSYNNGIIYYVKEDRFYVENTVMYALAISI